MLICTLVEVNIPADMPPEQVQELRRRETARAQELQRAGTLRHLWRVAGKVANVSVWDVADNDEFHEVLSSLALFPYFDIQVIPLSRHPSDISEN
ncbi:muconolactone delta-isomerase [Pseudomonas sp. S31]|uniref:muconolactone Delta-isomerase n=1 Tax=Pseudomonas sp. S31 TaxID=1564473 RepID=UPI0019129FF9|nr:muconolactone Delta-isomerase family protein [Pseudomonas sp. S31]MBK5002423.1 muconolactone delta-isomerase [Pseudomonas sp. S31]